MTIAQFQKKVLNWYKKNKRDLPWRNTEDPYQILVSEIMLQQTQISRVLPKYQEFLLTFPAMQSLAQAPQSKLLEIWKGLGYWRRALFLRDTARMIAKDTPLYTREYPLQDRYPHLNPVGLNPTKFPESPEELEKLPGIGHYTARALACFAFQSKEAFLDTNIRRVYLHFFFEKKTDVSDKEILKVAQQAIDSLPKGITSREWHYALFDYGADVLKNKQINKRSRHYHKQSPFNKSFRSFRTQAVRFLLSKPEKKAPKKLLKNFLSQELEKQEVSWRAEEVISALLQDKLISQNKNSYAL